MVLFFFSSRRRQTRCALVTVVQTCALPISVNDLIEALDDPILVLAGNHVVRANTAARALLGAHVLGQDVRLAVRHPDAARRLGESSDSGEPVTLLGLGRRDSDRKSVV